MFKRILCAVDGSEPSGRAVTAAAAMAKAMGGQLVLIVVDQVTFDGHGKPEHKLGPSEVQRLLGEAKDLAVAADFASPLLATVESRDVARAIINYTEAHGIDHIVVGTGEKRAATRLVVGSVSQALVTDARCSVTVAR